MIRGTTKVSQFGARNSNRKSPKICVSRYRLQVAPVREGYTGCRRGGRDAVEITPHIKSPQIQRFSPARLQAQLPAQRHSSTKPLCRKLCLCFRCGEPLCRILCLESTIVPEFVPVVLLADHALWADIKIFLSGGRQAFQNAPKRCEIEHNKSSLYLKFICTPKLPIAPRGQLLVLELLNALLCIYEDIHRF